jgi:hypothetical protein
VAPIVAAYAAWLATSGVPKLFVKAEPGALLAGGGNLDFARGLPTQAEVTVARAHYLQEDSPDEIGRAIAGWALGVGLTRAMKGYDGVASYSWLRRSRRRVDSGTLQGESAAKVPGCFPLLSLTRAQR